MKHKANINHIRTGEYSIFFFPPIKSDEKIDRVEIKFDGRKKRYIAEVEIHQKTEEEHE